MVPNLARSEWAVQQKYPTFDQGSQHVVAFEKNPLMARDEVCFGDQIAGTNRLRTKAKMGNGHGPRLFRIVDKVTLGVVISVLANDFDGILIGADSAIGP